MKKRTLLAALAASALFAACEHGAPQPGPREMQPMGPQPTPVETTPQPARSGDPTSSEARPAEIPTRHHERAMPIAPVDAGTPLPSTTQPSPTGTINPGPSAMLDTRRDLHSDNDLHLLPPAQRMPVTNVPAQPMQAMPGEAEPSSIKPDGGILYDGGVPLPPIPDGGPLQSRDASVPL